MNHSIAGHADGVRRLVNNFPPNVYAAYVTDTQYRFFSLISFFFDREKKGGAVLCPF